MKRNVISSINTLHLSSHCVSAYKYNKLIPKYKPRTLCLTINTWEIESEGKPVVQRAHRTSGCFPSLSRPSLSRPHTHTDSFSNPCSLQRETAVRGRSRLFHLPPRCFRPALLSLSFPSFTLRFSLVFPYCALSAMDDLFRLQHEGMSISGANAAAAAAIDFSRSVDNNNVYRFDSTDAGAGTSDLIKSQIVSHPRYPSLVSAYIECRKVPSLLLSPVAFIAFFFFLTIRLLLSFFRGCLFYFLFLFPPPFCRLERRQKWRRCLKKSVERIGWWTVATEKLVPIRNSTSSWYQPWGLNPETIK